MTKQALREQISAKICDISHEYRKNASGTISDIVADIICANGFKTAFVYQSFGCEVDTSSLISRLRQSVQITVPKLFGDKMDAVLYSSEQLKNSYGIFEPIENVLAPSAQVAVIPAVAFDRQGNRLGRGKGYYDKYLADKDMLRIGIAFDCQLVDKLPSCPHDVKMDMIITEKTVLSTSFKGQAYEKS